MPKVLTNGVTRIVVLWGVHAFKVPHILNGWRNFLTGLLCNMQEREWAGVSPKLCPIVFSTWGGWLVVMKRVRPLTDEEWDSFNLDEFYNEPDLTFPVEPKRCSFGVLDGRIVAVDYG